MIKNIGLLFLFLMLGLSAFADKTVLATDPSVRFVGRVQCLDNGCVRYDWVGTYAETSFTGSSISAKIADEGDSWYNVYIDGNWKSKIHVTGKTPHEVLLAKDLAKGFHRLTLQKCTEGEYGMGTLYSFTAKGNAAFKPAEARKMMIEFIGDSYSCGYGVDGANKNEHFKLSTEDCSKAYDCLIAKHFDADYCLVAHSGMGVVRNYNGKKMRTMSQRYPLLFDNHDSIAYDFKAYCPNLVIINLGTNDFSVNGAPADFVTGYVALINTVRSHYPNVPVLCVTPHSANTYLLAAMKELRHAVSGMKDVVVAQPMPGVVVENRDLGSDWHPNWKGQRKIAMTLIPLVASMIGQ